MATLQRRGFLKLVTAVSSLLSLKPATASARPKDVAYLDKSKANEPSGLSIRQTRLRRMSR